nr:MAG TPA: hypothetical protein [Caudoviricetes sp.]
MDPEFLTIQLDDIEYWDDLKEEFVIQEGAECVYHGSGVFNYTIRRYRILG